MVLNENGDWRDSLAVGPRSLKCLEVPEAREMENGGNVHIPIHMRTPSDCSTE